MSKILVLDDRQFQELKRIFESTMQNSFMPQDLETTSFYDSIQIAFEDAEKENRSVLEWHPMSDKPKDQSDILVKDTNGAIFDSFAYYYENEWLIERGNKAQIIEWAYLPKE